MEHSIRILHLEDNPVDAELVQEIIESAGLVFRITLAQTGEAFHEALYRGGYDVILADFRLPAYDGMSALHLVQNMGLDIPFIFVSGTMGEDAAIEGLTQGATDYVLKQKLSRLVPAINRALNEAEDRRERRRAEAAVAHLSQEMQLILNSAGEGIFGTDINGTITFVNPAMSRMVGWEISELLGQQAHDVLHHSRPDGRSYPSEECPMQLAFQNGCSYYTDNEMFCRKDGASFPVEYTSTPIQQGDEILGNVVVIKDITERKQAEETLRRSERRNTILNRILRIFLTVPDEDVYGGVQSVVLDVMNSRLGLFGFLTDNSDLVFPGLTGDIWGECRVADKSIVFAPDKWGNSLFGKAITEKKSFYSNGPFHAPDGHVKIDNLLACPIVYGNQTIGLIGVANKEGSYSEEDRDLFENISINISPILNARLQRDREEYRRKQTEEALRRNEAKLRSILGAAPTGIGVDIDGIIHEANDSLCTMTGYSRQELLNNSSRFLYPTDAEYQFIELEQYERFSKLGAGAIETRWRRKDGTIINVLFSSALLDPGNISAGFTFTALDISERKRAEQELKESLTREQVLGDIIRNASVGIKIGHPDGAIVPLNTAMVNITGYSAEELKTTDWSNLITPPEWRENEQACLAELRRTGRPVTYEKEYIRKDGSRVPVQLVVHGMFDAGGNQDRYIAFVTDISIRKAAEYERRNMETRIRQAQKMEAIGTLAGGIAHDFNNILSAIIGYTEMGLNKTPEESPLRHFLEQVLKGSSRATDLVGQILTFSRQTEEKHGPMLVGPIIKEALKLLRASIPSTIEIRHQIPVTSQNMIMGDATQIHQVIMNLCTNAAHAMREHGGTLEVELTDVDLSEPDRAFQFQLEPGRYLCLKVSDTGHGMDEDTMQRIFDPFFTTKSREEGTGMGLAVVHGIVESCGGTITVQSKPGVGSSFSVYFPVAVSSDTERRVESKEAPGGKGIILFVDDEESLVKLARLMLESLGYSVVAKTSSLEALEAFRSEPDRFDLIITDFTMPRMTGIELAKQIWRIRADMPIILCTGYTELIHDKSITELGFRELVHKPILRHRMAQAIKRSLRPK
ncbi:MAG: PAS domain S-box protein [Syntrophobacteraceae bacterium]